MMWSVIHTSRYRSDSWFSPGLEMGGKWIPKIFLDIINPTRFGDSYLEFEHLGPETGGLLCL